MERWLKIFSELFWFFGMRLTNFALLARLPRVLLDTVCLFLGQSMNESFHSFGRIDAGFRSWYDKIALDLRMRGRMGFVPEDGLGAPFGARIYNNSFIYWLLRQLGGGRLALVGWLGTVLSVMVLSGLTWPVWITVAVVVLISVSPVVVSANTTLGKPEMVMWPIMIWFWWICLGGSGVGMLVLGFGWSLLAFMCFSTAFIGAVFAAPLLLWRALNLDGLGLLVLGVAPGVLKLAWRLYHMHQAGFVGKLAQEQSKVIRIRWFPTPLELKHILPFVLSIIGSGYSGGLPWHTVLILLGWVLPNWINWRGFYFADQQSLVLAQFSMAIVFAAWTGSFVGLLGAVALVWICIQDHDAPDGLERHDRLRWQWKNYPVDRGLERAASPAVAAFFSLIANNSRFIAESTGGALQDGPLRGFYSWTRSFLPHRGVEQADYEYTRMLEPDLSRERLDTFSADLQDCSRMSETAHGLGARYVVCHTELTRDGLVSGGWQVLGSLSNNELLPIALSIRRVPERLWLLQSPSCLELVEGAVSWNWERSSLLIQVAGPTELLVRWRHVPWARAVQSGFPIEVTAYQPFAECPLKFMRLLVAQAGEVRLELSQPLFWLD
jgi:hypothetical protein